MVRVMNFLLGFLNILTFIVSLGILAGSLYLHLHAESVCEKAIAMPFMIIGAALLVVSLMGLFGSCCRITFLSAIYQLVLFLLILALLAFTVFSFIVTNKGAGDAVSGQGYKHFRLGDYSHWLQKRVNKASNWEKIKSCLNDAAVCRSLGPNSGVDRRRAKFYQLYLDAVQSGCCRPPADCGLKPQNVTYWTAPKGTLASADPDCKTWSNDQELLCFDCKSCKAGFLDNLRKQWRRIAVLNIAGVVLLIIFYTIGCCVYKNNRNDNRYKRYRVPYPYR